MVKYKQDKVDNLKKNSLIKADYSSFNSEINSKGVHQKSATYEYATMYKIYEYYLASYWWQRNC